MASDKKIQDDEFGLGRCGKSMDVNGFQTTGQAFSRADKMDKGMMLDSSATCSSRASWPKFSIITVTLNSAATLEETIHSVIAQGYPQVEYVIVDGCSTDGTVDIIRKYEPFLARWVSEPDGGITDAFNKGLRMTTGEIVGIVSADDYLLPGALEQVAKVYLDHPEADVIYGNAVFIEPYNQRQFVVKPDADLRTIWRRQPLKHAATFVARQTYERFGLFDPAYRLAMDYELILRFYVQGARFVYLDTPLVAFRYGGANWTHLHDTIREARDISVRHGYSPLKAYPIYWGKLIKAWLRGLVVRANLVGLLNLRRHFSHRFSEYRSGQ